MPEKWLTTRQAADLWQVTPWTIRAWFHAGRVQGVKFGPRTIRILVMSDEGGTDGVQEGAGREEAVRG